MDNLFNTSNKVLLDTITILLSQQELETQTLVIKDQVSTPVLHLEGV